MGSKAVTLNTEGNFEITIRKHDVLDGVTLIKSSDINKGLKYTQAGLSKNEVTQLIRNLMEVSGVTQEDLEEKEYLWRVPPELSGEGDIPWLVYDKCSGKYLISRSEELGDYYIEFFTEAEVEAVKKDHPIFSVLVKDE